jgi:mRNA interferase HigB
MKVVTKKRIDDFIALYPDSKSSLHSWYKTISKNDFASFNDLKNTFTSADMVEGVIVFNISGNKYRLIVHIPFKIKRVYILHIITHSDYDKNKWRRPNAGVTTKKHK